MTALLPHVVRNAIESESVRSASESFGVVALVVLVVLMIEHESVRAGQAAPARMTILSAVVAPLLLVVTLMIAARVAALLP